MGKTAGKPLHFSTLLHHLFKIQGPNETYADFLARLVTAISRTVIGEKNQKATREITCLWKYKSGMSKSYSSNSWDRDYYWLFEGLSQARIINLKDTNAS